VFLVQLIHSAENSVLTNTGSIQNVPLRLNSYQNITVMTQQLPARSSTHVDWLGLCSVLRPRQHSKHCSINQSV